MPSAKTSVRNRTPKAVLHLLRRDRREYFAGIAIGALVAVGTFDGQLRGLHSPLGIVLIFTAWSIACAFSFEIREKRIRRRLAAIRELGRCPCERCLYPLDEDQEICPECGNRILPESLREIWRHYVSWKTSHPLEDD